MKNKIISRIFYSVIMIIISISIFTFAIIDNSQNKDYLLGFGGGFLMINIIMIVKNLQLLSNPKKLKEIEVVEKDERILKIVNDSYAMTFRITLFIEAIITMILAILSKKDISYIIGMVLGIQLIVFFVTYVIYSKKN